VVHLTDHAGAVYRAAVKKVPILATCHDLLQIRSALGEIPEQKVGRTGQNYQAWILKSLARLPQIACVSENTRGDVLRLTGIRPSQAPVILNALNYPYRRIPAVIARARLAEMARARGLDPKSFEAARGGFILNVGGAHWYKNRPGLLAIHACLERLIAPSPALVMVGPSLSEGEASALAPNQRLIRLEGATHSELEALYNAAEGLLFPSWQEGFGWPIAEAQACGCPVFASNRAPMTEVGGGSSVYFDPRDPSGAAQAIAGAWDSRDSRRAPTLAQSLRWQPDRMLGAYEDLYRRAAA
jgi:glycosyltransferase involved in cell wall biosynthesis